MNEHNLKDILQGFAFFMITKGDGQTAIRNKTKSKDLFSATLLKFYLLVLY